MRQTKEETMKTISRDHDFENKLNLVQKGKKYFYLYHEKSVNPVRIEITTKGKVAFNSYNWNYFEKAEANYFGGCLD
jgi:hypothetical protein